MIQFFFPSEIKVKIFCDASVAHSYYLCTGMCNYEDLQNTHINNALQMKTEKT